MGVTSEVSLPDLSPLTTTISGAGMAGEIESASIGMFGSIKQEINFRMLSQEMLKMYNPLKPVKLTLRSSVQSTVKSTNEITTQGMRIVFGGHPLDLKPGTVKQGDQMSATITLEVTYLLIEVDGKTMLELDKLNDIYVVNQVDILEKVRSQC